MNKYLQKALPIVLLSIGLSSVINAQTIVQQDFEDPPASPFVTYSKSTSGNVVYFEGTTGTSASNANPAGSPFQVGGSRVGIVFRGSSDGSRGIGYINTAQINTAAYRDIKLSLRVAAFGFNGTGSGVSQNDYVKISISSDGNNFIEKLKITGNSNAAWSFTGGTGIAKHSYDQPMSTYGPSGGGIRSTDGYSTMEISEIPPLSAMWVRIEMSTSYMHNVWCIDNLIITGTRTLVGTGNTLYGEESGTKITSGLGNTFIGYKSGENVTSGLRNTFIGIDAGKGISTGNTNTMIGYNASATGTNASNLTNATAIGSEAKVTVSNAVVLGNNANVGIGTSAPANKLEISASADNQSGLRFTKLKSTSTTSPANNVSLSVDANGDVILTPSALAASPWKIASGTISQTDQTQRVVIGTMPASLPANYKLYVSDGILAERVKVALKSSDKWSDYVFSPNYTLWPLNKVEAFVKKHHHLPGVPSADEVVEQGIDVATMNAKLLEKIEELTLHMIHQEKILLKNQEEIKRLTIKLKQIKKKK